MASYKFLISDGRFSTDGGIFELADNTAAYFEALHIAGKALINNPARIARRRSWSVDVLDQRGILIYNVVIAANEMDLDFNTNSANSTPSP